MKEIEVHSRLYPGTVALVDDEDYEFLNQFRWSCTHRHGKYKQAKTIINGKRVRMHRLLLDAPDDMLIDHIDHNGLNNQKANLRLATTSQNGLNRLPNSNAVSKFKGVHWHKNRKKWCAMAGLNGVRYHLGYYEDEVVAAVAYNLFAKQFHGEFAVLNKI